MSYASDINKNKDLFASSHVHNFDGNTTTYTYQYTKIRVTEEQAALLQEKYSKDRIYIAE